MSITRHNDTGRLRTCGVDVYDAGGLIASRVLEDGAGVSGRGPIQVTPQPIIDEHLRLRGHVDQ